MNNEELNSLEQTERIIDKNEDFLPLLEISNEDPNVIKEQIRESLNKFIEQDKKIGEIEKSINITKAQDIEEVKEELNLEDELKKINTEADKLETETVFQVDGLDDKQTDNTEKHNKYTEDIKKAELELGDLNNRKLELKEGEYDIRKKSIEIKILVAKGNILESDNEDLNYNNKIEIKDSKEEKIANEQLNNFLDKLILVEEKSNSFGYDLDSVLKFKDSEDIDEGNIYKQVIEFAESLHVEELADLVLEKQSDKLVDILYGDKIKSYALKAHIFDDILKNKEIPQDRLIELAFSKIINNENNEEIINSINYRLSKDKQGALKKLPVEDFIDSWEQDYPSVKGWSESSSVQELNTFSQKIGIEIDELSKRNDTNGILKLKERLDLLSKDKNFYNRNTATFEESYPEWLKKMNINSEDSLKILTKDLSEKEFTYYMYTTKKFVPFHLFPENLSEITKNEYYDRLFTTSFKIDDLNEYEKLTNKKPFEIVSNILNNFSYQTDNPGDVLFETRDYMLKNNIPEDSLVNVTQECFSKELLSGKIKQSLIIKKEFNLTEEFINKTIEEVFLQKLLNGNVDDSLEIKNNFKVNDSFLDSAEAVSAIKQCFKEQMINGNVNSSEKIIETFNLNSEFLDQDDIVEVVQECLHKNRFDLKSFANFERKFKLKENIDLLKNGEIKNQSFQRIEEAFYFKNNPERLPEKMKETLNRFENQYGDKGKDLINLAIYTYGVENINEFMLNIAHIEKVLNKYNPENIPEEGKVSMGIEYEVTDSISESYKENSLLGYKNDISLVSEIGNIGKGNDAVHEIALKPNYNPYMLMAEIKLLQDANLLDFNFEKYQQAPRGYHLSLVGDSGLSVDENMHFLNNIMTMTQISGITAGKEVLSTKNIHVKSFENIPNHNQKGVRCEIKGMATDSIEQFEKAIITAHHSGIAIQLFNKYLDKTFIPPDLPDSSEDFEKALTSSGILLKPFESDQERDIVYEWAKLKKETMEAVDQHNDSFADSEFNGYIFDKKGEFKETLNDKDRSLNLKHLEDSKITQEELINKIKITKDDFFGNQTERFVNQLTRLNNFFLFKSIYPDKGQYIAIKQPTGEIVEILNLSNIHTMWNMRTEGDVLMENSYKNPQNISIFDNGGTIRDGYYSVQGASEEMIIHKSQILLNRFNKNIEKLLETKGVKRDVAKEELITA
jgi:hypothetical protein